MCSTNGEGKDILVMSPHVRGDSQKKDKKSLDGEALRTVKSVPVIEISLVIAVILQKLHLLMTAYLSVKSFVCS